MASANVSVPIVHSSEDEIAVDGGESDIRSSDSDASLNDQGSPMYFDIYKCSKSMQTIILK